MNKVRLSDIAKAAGVSTATVSNALNRKNRLNPEKADEIRNLAIKMGYRPIHDNPLSHIH